MRSVGPRATSGKEATMETVTLCECGCGEPAVFAREHVRRTARIVITEDDYDVRDLGHQTPCWIAKAKGRGDGTKYATLRVLGKIDLAHRLMYRQEIGPIPDGLWLDHLCRNTRCIRPDHLEPVTPAVNRQRRHNAKLTLTQATAIKRAKGAQSARALADEYGVAISLVYAIWAGKVWTNA